MPESNDPAVPDEGMLGFHHRVWRLYCTDFLPKFSSVAPYWRVTLCRGRWRGPLCRVRLSFPLVCSAEAGLYLSFLPLPFAPFALCSCPSPHFRIQYPSKGASMPYSQTTGSPASPAPARCRAHHPLRFSASPQCAVYHCIDRYAKIRNIVNVITTNIEGVYYANG